MDIDVDVESLAGSSLPDGSEDEAEEGSADEEEDAPKFDIKDIQDTDDESPGRKERVKNLLKTPGGNIDVDQFRAPDTPIPPPQLDPDSESSKDKRKSKSKRVDGEKKKKKNKKFEQSLRDLRRRTKENVWQRRQDEEHKHEFGPTVRGPDGISQQICHSCGFTIDIEEF